MDEGKIVEHESFGMLSISRINSNKPHNLFGSSIGHTNTIELKIRHAEMERHLNREWYYPKWEIVSIEMSPTQFTDAITSMNTQGVPVTIRYKEGERMEDPPFEHVRDTFSKEFKKDLQEIMGTVGQTILETEKALSAKTVKKKDLKEVLANLEKLKRDLYANLPFVEKSFHEQVDKSVTEAKGEIEGFFESKIRALGSEKLVEALEEGVLNNVNLLEE